LHYGDDSIEQGDWLQYISSCFSTALFNMSLRWIMEGAKPPSSRRHFCYGNTSIGSSLTSIICDQHYLDRYCWSQMYPSRYWTDRYTVGTAGLPSAVLWPCPLLIQHIRYFCLAYLKLNDIVKEKKHRLSIKNNVRNSSVCRLCVLPPGGRITAAPCSGTSQAEVEAHNYLHSCLLDTYCHHWLGNINVNGNLENRGL